MRLNISIKTDNDRIRPENSEVSRLVCNNNKLLNYTRWKPQYGLGEGLMETIEWFDKNSPRYKEVSYDV